MIVPLLGLELSPESRTHYQPTL